MADLVRRSDGVLIAAASVDPVELGRDAAVAEARRAVQQLGLRAINIDAGFYAEPMHADDARLLPLYEACKQLGVPAFVMSGPTTPDLAFNDPLAVDRLAKTSPRLPIVCCHGFYANVRRTPLDPGCCRIVPSRASSSTAANVTETAAQQRRRGHRPEPHDARWRETGEADRGRRASIGTKCRDAAGDHRVGWRLRAQPPSPARAEFRGDRGQGHRRSTLPIWAI